MKSLAAKTFIAVAALTFATSWALPEVKESDPGASCTTSTETIQGQQASCKSCSATKCDTSGSTISNCRVETTKTCTIAGRVVDPGGGKTNVMPVQPSKVLEMSPDTGKNDGLKAPVDAIKKQKKNAKP